RVVVTSVGLMAAKERRVIACNKMPRQSLSIASAVFCALLSSASSSTADVALPRTVSSATPLLWPRLPPAPADAASAPRIESAGAEIDLYPTVLHARVSAQVSFGGASPRGLYMGIPESTSLTPREGRPLLFLSVHVDGNKVEAKRLDFTCVAGVPQPALGW